MYGIVLLISLFNTSTYYPPPRGQVHIQQLQIQTDERTGRPSTGSATVIVYDRASDMR